MIVYDDFDGKNDCCWRVVVWFLGVVGFGCFGEDDGVGIYGKSDWVFEVVSLGGDEVLVGCYFLWFGVVGWWGEVVWVVEGGVVYVVV